MLLFGQVHVILIPLGSHSYQFCPQFPLSSHISASLLFNIRYQYDLNAPGAASQIRLTTTRDLNLNISVSNANMIIQAYASWNNLNDAHENYKSQVNFFHLICMIKSKHMHTVIWVLVCPVHVHTCISALISWWCICCLILFYLLNTVYPLLQEPFSPTYSGRSIIEVHQKRNYFIIPQNKLGQDIFIRACEIRGFSNIIKMPSGDIKPMKVPVSKNMLDSHMNGKMSRIVRTMVTIIIVDAEVCVIR